MSKIIKEHCLKVETKLIGAPALSYHNIKSILYGAISVCKHCSRKGIKTVSEIKVLKPEWYKSIVEAMTI